MRLQTVATARGTRLLVERDGEMLDLADCMEAAGEPWSDSLHDAGGLLAAGPGLLDRIRSVLDTAVPQALRAQTHEHIDRVLPPVTRPSKIICVGLNYAKHAAEGNRPLPKQPLLFAKFPSALVGEGGVVCKPSSTDALDYEGELAVVIGRRATDVSEAEALGHVGGYSIINDISARDLQASEPQWIRAKAQDTFAPMGPYLVTPDEVGDVAALRLQTAVNAELRQDSLCSDMIFNVAELIAFISRSVTLMPGDVIATGTPAGVGHGFDPPRYLKRGDVVEISITNLGTLHCTVADR